MKITILFISCGILLLVCALLITKQSTKSSAHASKDNLWGSWCRSKKPSDWFLLIFTIGFSCMLALSVLSERNEEKRHSHWKEIDGEIYSWVEHDEVWEVKRGVSRRIENRTSFSKSYRYVVEGKTYTGHVDGSYKGTSHFVRNGASRERVNHPLITKVYYNPSNPHESVLIKSKFSWCQWHIIGGLFIIAICLFIFLF